jgi:hypothetical protein
MSNDNLTPEEDEADANLTPTENESEDALDDLLEEEEEAEQLNEEAEKIFLKKVNETAKKNFQSVDQIVNSLKESDEKFREEGRKKKDEVVNQSKPKVGIPNDRDERLLKLENPNSIYVLEEMREEASKSKCSILDIWDRSHYFKLEAQIRSEAEKTKETNIRKVGFPSAGVVIDNDNETIKVNGEIVKLTAEDRKFMRESGISPKEVAKTIAKRV